jgi:SsrA-binding protein
MKPLVSHKRAKFDFEILETYEAGLVLSGTEVKSLRRGQGKLEGAHVVVRGDEAFLVGASIPPFQAANAPADYEPEATRKLLLSRKELAELEKQGDQKGLTIVPLSVYNKGRNLKLSIAVARGKKKADKRESIKARESKREIERQLKRQH